MVHPTKQLSLSPVVVVVAVVMAVAAAVGSSSGLAFAAVVAFVPSPTTPARLLALTTTLRSHPANTSSARRSRGNYNFDALYYKHLPHDDDGDHDVISSDEMGNISAMTRNNIGKSTTIASTRAISSRISPIIELNSIQDYRNHILLDDNDHCEGRTTAGPLCIIRFSAPWCKVCRSTDVAWERMASKFSSAATITTTSAAASKQIKFFAVNLNNKNNNNRDNDGGGGGTSALKDMLRIDRVPQGIIHHPSLGIHEQKVNLHRTNLASLKKRLERYLSAFDYADSDNKNSILRMEGEYDDGFWNVV